RHGGGVLGGGAPAPPPAGGLMRAAVFQGAGRIVTGEWPRPAAGVGELLLRVRGCGLCGSDIAKITAPDTRAPMVLGHELVGDVVEVGPGVAGFVEGSGGGGG